MPGCNNNAVESEAECDVNHTATVEQNDEDIMADDFSWLGYMCPTPSELRGGASRTELYRCRSCMSYTRFPRYNKALWVTTTRRGRCGEYSMLLYRMLRTFGFQSVRWCVDWADHVWVEVWLGNSRDGREDEDGEPGGRWVHLDPCEAAVDNPLLYESWGKKQTYILAFHDPFYSNSGGKALCTDLESLQRQYTVGEEQSSSRIDQNGKANRRYQFPPVEDVTRQYTSDEEHVIAERRGIGEEQVAEVIRDVSGNMVDLLQQLVTSDKLPCQ